MKNIIMLLFSLTLIACGGGGGSTENAATPTTDPNTTFLFTDLNRIPNIGDTYTLKLAGNIDGSGEAVNMSLTIKNTGTTIFNGKSVDVEDVLGSVKIPALSIDTSTIYTYYYGSNGTFVRSYNKDTGQICLATGSVNSYPSKVKVGDFGSSIPESCSDGNTSSGTWRVESVDSTHANIIISETDRDSFGNINTTSTETLKIDTSGNVTNVSVKVTNYTSGKADLSMSLTGRI